jgi:hypothetical protein
MSIPFPSAAPTGVYHMLLLLQYIQYKTSLPDFQEFTICLWHKFYNHSNDHPLFSYAGKSECMHTPPFSEV